MDFLTQPEIKMQTVIFCSGNTLYGELGLRGIEDDHVFKLTPLTHFVHSNMVEDIASGLNHTVVLLQNGQVFTCGNNDSGQLGRENSHRKLELVESLAVHSIRRIACGVRFSVVLSDAGQLFSWGDNSHGELGLSIEDENVAIPRIIRGLALKQVVQVSCGSSHCLALTSDGELYSWGDNSFSQLGLGTTTSEKQPRCITSLIGLPILQIASGGNHSFALTLSGALFGWGKNEFGQLGLSDTVDRKLPSLQKTLRSQHVTFVCCGDNHTAVLTKDGGVFTFGAGMYGQLGHGSKTNELLPRKVLDLMGNTVTQVACGRCHTLAYVPSKKRLHSFGLGGSGQLCVGVTPTNYYSPVLVALPWVNSPVASFEQPGHKNDDILVCDYDGNLKHHSEERYNFNDSFSTPMEVDDGDFNEDLEHHEHSEESKLDYAGREKLGKTINFNIEVYKIICGGDRSFVIAGHYDPSIENCVESYVDFRELPQGCHIVTLRNDILKEVMVIPSSDCVPQDLMSYIETTFSSSACLNGSFLKGNGTHFCCSAENHGIDMSTASLCFRYIFDAKNSSIANVVGDCLEAMFSNLQPPMDIEGLRLYLFLPLCHLFQNPEKYLGSVIYPFLRTLVELPTEMTTVIGLWWIEIGILHFKNLVTILKNTILFIIKDDANRFEQESRILTFHTALQKKQLLSALDVLNALQSLNSRKKELLPYQDFYIPEITEIIDIRQDYLTWLFAPPDQRSRFILLCDYPFIFDSNAKSLILKADSHIQMQTAMDIAYRQTITSSFLPIVQPSAPLLVLRVSRDHIVANTIEQLSHQQSTDLKKPLHVVFWGEDAVDAGGVKKEFFLLLSKAILDPKYGMFIEYHETHCIWFHPQTFEEDVMYYLIGIVCGLAIYNSIIIDLPFPLVLYKKLLKEEVKFDDLKGLSPSIFRSLTSLLQYDDDDVEEVFILNFEISLEIFGENMTYELKPNGKNIPVTKENKEEYVDLYVDFVLNKSVQVPFEAFARGFYKVCNSKILELFHAQELMTLVVGNEAYDWVVFEENTEYKNGYTRDHEAIKMFWRVFHSLDLSDKRKFLLFLTGSDRIPILGMKEIKVFMQPMNVNDDHLPVAHTCFNILDLPYYSSEEILRTKLCQAIQHTEGFGLA